MKSKQKIEIPEDLGLVIAVSPEHKAWEDILKKVELDIEMGKRENEINHAIVALAKKKIAKEKGKL